VLLLLVSFNLKAGDPASNFLAIPDLNNTEGLVEFKMYNAGLSSNVILRITWSNGDIVEEEYDRRNPMDIIGASGRYKGTNWSRRASVITIVEEPNESKKRLAARMHAGSIAESLLTIILNRGFLTNEVTTLQRLDDSTIMVKLDGRFLKKCHLGETNNNLSYVSFDYGKSRFIRKYTLREFVPGAYVPGYLQCAIIKSNLTRVINEFEITFLTNSASGASLSPWERYATNLQYAFRAKENVYFVANGQRIQVSTTEQEQRMNKQLSIIRYMFLAVLLVSTVVAPIVFWRFRKTIESSNKSEQTTIK
jgi:hypothetical protein